MEEATARSPGWDDPRLNQALNRAVVATARRAVSAYSRRDMAESVIAFTRSRGVVGRIYLADADSGRVRPLTGPELDLHDPAWAPDGSRLVALGRDRSGGPIPQLYLIDAASGDAERLTHDGASKLRPTWSADGSAIVLQISIGRAGYHLFALPLDGGGLRQITGPPLRARLPPAPSPGARLIPWAEEAGSDPSPSEEMPACSPDGAAIAFVRVGLLPRRREDDSGFAHHIWVASTNGAGEVPLTRGPVHDHDPAYSPNGASIAFTRYVDGEMIGGPPGGYSAIRLYVMDANGADVQAITPDPAAYRGPSWSPDGTQLVCSRSVDWGPTHLFLVGADGSEGRVLTDPEKDGDYGPVWRP
jgi:Tol biopolymer transport system component